jgi:hypothetical protein
VWDAALYILLGLTLTLALLDPATAGDRWLLAGLTTLVAGWHLAFQRLGLTEERPRLALVHLVGLLSVWFVLAGLHPVYFSLLLVLYPRSSGTCACPWPSRRRSRSPSRSSGGRSWRRAGP